jgi:rRNA maturation RNase YbeY
MVDLVNDSNYKVSFTVDQIHALFTKILKEESSSKILSPITIVLGDDEWLLDYNKTYLDHDYYTDIITFDYSDENVVSGDLLISVERVSDNAAFLNVPRETELLRVVIHGFLHLLGYEDNTDAKKSLMREKEDLYISLFI